MSLCYIDTIRGAVLTVLTTVANIFGVSLVFGTFGGVLVLGGNMISVLVDGGPVSRENISARCCRADNYSLAMGRKGVAGRGCKRAVFSCAAVSLATLAKDIFGIS